MEKVKKTIFKHGWAIFGSQSLSSFSVFRRDCLQAMGSSSWLGRDVIKEIFFSIYRNIELPNIELSHMEDQ